MTDIERKEYECTLRHVMSFKKAISIMTENLNSVKTHLNNLLTEEHPGEKCMPASPYLMDKRILNSIKIMKDAINDYED